MDMVVSVCYVVSEMVRRVSWIVVELNKYTSKYDVVIWHRQFSSDRHSIYENENMCLSADGKYF